MRAREFVINVPINIKINGDGDPEVSTLDIPDDNENDDIMTPVKNQSTNDKDAEVGAFVPPLQQKIELMKATAGKKSKVISQLTADEDEPFEG